MDEIKNALNAGKEVITHTDAVSVPGWSGAGYIITDPVTGDGAYKISGGGNGGTLFLGILNGLGFAALLTGYAFGAAPLLLMTLAILLISSLIAAIIAIAKSDVDSTCYSKGIFTGMELFAAILGILGTKYTTGTPNLKKLIQTSFATIFLSAVVPTNTVPACL